MFGYLDTLNNSDTSNASTPSPTHQYKEVEEEQQQPYIITDADIKETQQVLSELKNSKISPADFPPLDYPKKNKKSRVRIKTSGKDVHSIHLNIDSVLFRNRSNK